MSKRRDLKLKCVEVNKEDFVSGKQGDCNECPPHLAWRRIIERWNDEYGCEQHFVVNGAHVRFFRLLKSERSLFQSVSSPRWAQDFIRRCDLTKDERRFELPFRSRLRVSEELLA